ncbi:aminopeptidase P family protein [Alloacidobacterium dinghuense]|uniref:Aminopeptidase P family protein n=1 Tax=Alloacidobacterium dinghuense TaxID=2763107 RepID=A0A7G8BNS5_9BACT|nr:Xaa-Pro peptidase family protein [Alloacidobacterium dinghuense]QNI34195.1 aminopeptidase P family protein [Alloacidobacterium dinghuense]
MFSRRNFLWGSSAAALVALRPDARAQQGAPMASPGSVPPAIAALPDLSGQARPFTNDERLARIERARQLMVENKVDAIILSNNATSSVYFANIRFGGSERFWALVIPAKAKPFVVCPAFEEDRARELLESGPFGKDTEILTWQEDENPFALTVKGLKDRGIAAGTVGLDENMKFIFADSLAKAGPGLHFVSALPVTAGCRMIKDQHELDCIALACRATLLVYRAVYQSLQEGMMTRDVRRLIQAGYQKVGFEGEASLNIGEFTASPHGSIQPQTIREGTILMLDDGCSVEGYTSDITRTFVLGKATDKMKSVFDVVKKAQSAALAAAKPGVALASVDAAARRVIVDAGYGPGFKYFTHRVGHGMGMDMHEWSYLVKNNMFGWELNPALRPNMVFSDEPGVYIRCEFGVRLEDDMHVTENGAELFTPQSPSLEDPFGNVE